MVILSEAKDLIRIHRYARNGNNVIPNIKNKITYRKEVIV